MDISPRGERPRVATPHIFCKACASPLVQVSDWAREETGDWRVRIWCPECAYEHHAVLGREEVAYLSHAVEGGFAYLLEALAELQDSDDTGPSGLDLIHRLRAERITPAGT